MAQSPHLQSRGFVRLARDLLLVLLALALSYWGLVVALSIASVPGQGDFSDFAIYYAAAKGLRLGIGPGVYSPPMLGTIGSIPGGCAADPASGYIYPPLLAILLEPLTALPCVDASRVWRLGSVAIWVAVTALLAYQLWRRWPARPLLAAALVVIASGCSYLLLYGLWLGQVILPILGGLVLAAWLVERDHSLSAGLVLALVTLIKLLPAILILYFLLRGNWRVVAGAVLGGALLLGVMAAGAGLPTLLASVPVMLAAGGARPPGDEALAVVHPVLGSVLVVAAALIFVAVVLRAGRRGDERLGYAWAICTMLLVSPLVWWIYLPWLLPVFVACLAAIQPGNWRALTTLALLYAPAALPVVFPLFHTLAILGCWIATGLLFARSASLLPPDVQTLRHPKGVVLARTAPIMATGE